MRTVKAGAKGRPQVFNITAATLTRVATVATFTSNFPHDLKTGDKIKVSGADILAFNGGNVVDWTAGRFVVTVTNATVFTYVVATTPSADAIVTNVVAKRVLPTDQYDPFVAIHPQSASQMVERGGGDGGRFGGLFVDNAAGAKTGNWNVIYALANATITVLTGTLTNIPNPLTLNAGLELRGDFTAITVTVGSVIAYNNRPA